MITRAAYRAAASAIRASVLFNQNYSEADQEIRRTVQEHIATELCFSFKQDNPAFRKAVFLEACGLK